MDKPGVVFRTILWSAALAAFLFPSGAAAQMKKLPTAVPGAPGVAAGAITTSGRATVRVKADAARFTASFSLNGIASLPAAFDELDRISSAFARAGFDQASLSRTVQNLSLNNVQILVSGTFPSPTRERLAAAFGSILDAIGREPNLRFLQLSTVYLVNDCTAVENQARHLAFADARRRADALAKEAHLTLGAVSGISEAPGAPSPCANSPATNPFAGGQLELGADPTVALSYALTVSFSIP